MSVGEWLKPPSCPKTLRGAAAAYYKSHVRRLCDSGILGQNNWHSFVQLSAAWGDWEKWASLVAGMETADPGGMGLIEISKGVAKISAFQKYKQKAEAHYFKLHADFFKLAFKIFSSKPAEEEDDGFPD